MAKTKITKQVTELNEEQMETLRGYAEWGGAGSTYQWALDTIVAQGEALAAAQQENERLRRELRNAMPSQYPLERTVIRSRAEHPGGEQ